MGIVDDLVVENSITVNGSGLIDAGELKIRNGIKLGYKEDAGLADNCTVWFDGGNGTATLCTPPNGTEAGKHQLYLDNDSLDAENPKGVLVTAHNGLRIDVTNTSHLKVHNSEGNPVTMDVATPTQSSHAASKEYVDFHAGSTILFGALYCLAGNGFLIPGGPFAPSTDFMVSMRVPRCGILRNLYGQIDLPGGSSGKISFKVLVNGQETSLNVLDVEDTSCDFKNNVDSMVVSEGDKVSVMVEATSNFSGGKFYTVSLDFMPI